MQTMILNIDDNYLKSLIEFIKPIPKEMCDFKILDKAVDSDFDLNEIDNAYQSALHDLNNGDAMDLETYIFNRGIS